MIRRLVASREYKVMLLPERFAGSEDESRRAVDAFWSDVGRVLEEIDVPTEGSFDEVKAHRRIRFSTPPSAASMGSGTSSGSASTSRATSVR